MGFDIARFPQQNAYPIYWTIPTAISVLAESDVTFPSIAS